jgi:hypothetical protein
MGIFKKSLFLYFKNILRLTEVSSWICLPASIIFILFFFWGLSLVHLYLLMAIFFFSALPVLLLLLSIVVVKTIQALDQGIKLRTLGVYADGFNQFFPSFRILLWFSPILIVGFLCLYYAMVQRAEALKWSMDLMSIMIGGILILISGVLYHFFLMAFLLDGHKGKQALAISCRLIKPNAGRFVAGIVIACIWMGLFYFLIGPWVGKVYEMSLVGDLFPILFHVCLVNLFMVVVSIFPLVVFYFLYQEFRLKSVLNSTYEYG